MPPKKKQSRKRPREEEPSSILSSSSQDNTTTTSSKKNQNAEAVILTPHSRRLLKLLQDGTAEHAQVAAAQLTTITEQSNARVLWDILGRLQCYVTSSNNWRTRQNASVALQGVAQHLPFEDQQRFLYGSNQHITTTANMGVKDDDSNPQQQQQQQQHHWLTVTDLLTKERGGGNTLEMILQQGRRLLASSGSLYHQQDEIEEEELLKSLHQTTTTQDDKHSNREELFLKQRTQLQREILAKRLGLGGILGSVSRGPADAILSTLLPSSEVEPVSKEEETSLSSKRRQQQHIKNILKQQNSNQDGRVKTDDDNILEDGSSIRSILLSQLGASTSDDNDKDKKPASHRNPQELLATELIYRMFDAAWHVRHGATLGILALLRAWRRKQPHQDPHSQQPFGSWLHDILARCVCVMALDRFGDYSGTAIGGGEQEQEQEDSFYSSGVVVSPVQEVVGQLFSVLFDMAPYDIQTQCIQVLQALVSLSSTHNNNDNEESSTSWEVRKAGLVAIKYIAVLQDGNENENENDASHKHQFKFRKDCFVIATKCLNEDPSDDVRGAAAQALLRLLDRIPKTKKNHHHHQEEEKIQIQALSLAAWNAVKKTRIYASSITDVVHLFSALVQQNQELVLQALTCDNGGEIDCSTMKKGDSIYSEMIEHLVGLLEADYISVKKAILNSIACIISSISKSFSSSSSDQHSRDSNKDEAVQIAFRAAIVGVFDVFFDSSSFLRDDNADSSPSSLQSTLMRCWQSLVNSTTAMIIQSDNAVKKSYLVELLLSKYFVINGPGLVESRQAIATAQHELSASTGIALTCRLLQARAIVYFITATNKEGCLDTDQDLILTNLLLSFFLRCFLASPLLYHCESACLLYSTVASSFGPEQLQRLEHLDSSPIHETILGLLDNAPNCLLSDTADLTVSNHQGLVALYKESFFHGLKMVKEKGSNPIDSSTAVTELWKAAQSGKAVQIETKLSDVPTTPTSMRLAVTIIGSLLTGGSNKLPAKLTPLVRPLMTSIRNESDEACQNLASSYMAELLQILRQHLPPSEGFKKTYTKVLGSLCDLSTTELVPTSTSSSLVLRTLVQSLANDETIQDLAPMWDRLSLLLDASKTQLEHEDVKQCLLLLGVASESLSLVQNNGSLKHIVREFYTPVLQLACDSDSVKEVLPRARNILESWCRKDPSLTLQTLVPPLLRFCQDKQDDRKRVGACKVLLATVEGAGMQVCPWVRAILPVSMSLMTDSVRECAATASSLFAVLVRIAPVVPVRSGEDEMEDSRTSSVIDHLIHGRPLPPCKIPETIRQPLASAGITLRKYQEEGISWLRFLQSVKLNGALCDAMGVGKTIQSLVAIALSHLDVDGYCNKHLVSLVVCPSSVVGHWMSEIDRFFPGGSVFKPIALIGNSTSRDKLWRKGLAGYNIVVTNYSVLRSDAKRLAKTFWKYCILDEGHLLKNPKTATARAARQLRSDHRLILSGTPVQNNVNEVWAAFDFLMPNFLGTAKSFSKDFARPITKGQLVGASAKDIANSMEMLKVLHQQVLPFILRREKEQVLKELPPKIITTIPCQMSSSQFAIYRDFCESSTGQESLRDLQNAIQELDVDQQDSTGVGIGNAALKSLIFLRLLCTHPILVSKKKDAIASLKTEEGNINESGKLLVLKEILREAGIEGNDMLGADNDESAIYCGDASLDDADQDEIAGVIENNDGEALLSFHEKKDSGQKCLIFAQFTNSLDVVEELLLNRHLPSVDFLRLDGRVPEEQRQSIAHRFNTDPAIRILLLTTRVGGLGLNLTGADTVIFLEHDWNPHADLQAMDRAHRIGQKKTVNVFRLVTKDSIEDKIMKIQETKMAMSKAIVNTENSSMFSMGTEKLLDIFTFRQESDSSSKGKAEYESNLDTIVDRYIEDYATLSMKEFIQGFKKS